MPATATATTRTGELLVKVSNRGVIQAMIYNKRRDFFFFLYILNLLHCFHGCIPIHLKSDKRSKKHLLSFLKRLLPYIRLGKYQNLMKDEKAIFFPHDFVYFGKIGHINYHRNQISGSDLTLDPCILSSHTKKRVFQT